MLAGLDDPSQVQQVDILVPDGTWQAAAGTAADQPSITPALDWVLFRRHSDVSCSPPPSQLDTATLYADTAVSGEAAAADWGSLLNGQDVQWKEVGDLQFDAGATSLATTPATVQGWWTAAGMGTRLYGTAYAPAASASDQLALGRAGSLVAALSPTVSGQIVPPAALTASPELKPGAVGALFAVAWPPAVRVEVWTAKLQQPLADEVWNWLTGVGEAKEVRAHWTPAGAAMLTLETPSRVASWEHGTTVITDVIHAGYWPGSLAPGAAGVPALLDQIGGGTPSPIPALTNPPEGVGPDYVGNIFLIMLSPPGA